VVVTYVDSKGPSAAALVVGDVVEAINGTPLETPLHWKARALKLTAGESVNLRVRRNREIRELKLSAAPSPVLQKEFTVGLSLRNAPGAGSAVTAVEAGSVADRAGLRVGDVITLAGNARAPSPAAVMRAVEPVSAGEAVLVAFERDGTQAVTALEK
jgi:S1-C subfamily serine protease